MKPSPPLRFLLLVGGSWVCFRAAALSALWPGASPPASASSGLPAIEPASAAVEFHSGAGQEVPFVRFNAYGTPQSRPEMQSRPRRYASLSAGRSLPQPPTAVAAAAGEMYWELAAAPPPAAASAPAAAARAARTVPAFPAAAAPPILASSAPQRRSRWSGSAWAFVRGGGVPQLAAGGTLGGSQAGARLLYRLNHDPGRPLSLTARAYAPLETTGAEAAFGVEWQPVASIPLRLLAERRQSLSDGGRSAFSFLAHGGVYERRIAGPVLLDAYAQAGIVGLRSGDLFADGSAQLSVPLGGRGRLKGGAGIWGAAQPGVSRLDAGPQLSARFPIGRAALRVSADWRFRLSGKAEPSSGPALTVATEF